MYDAAPFQSSDEEEEPIYDNAAPDNYGGDFTPIMGNSTTRVSWSDLDETALVAMILDTMNLGKTFNDWKRDGGVQLTTNQTKCVMSLLDQRSVASNAHDDVVEALLGKFIDYEAMTDSIGPWTWSGDSSSLPMLHAVLQRKYDVEEVENIMGWAEQHPRDVIPFNAHELVDLKEQAESMNLDPDSLMEEISREHPCDFF